MTLTFAQGFGHVNQNAWERDGLRLPMRSGIIMVDSVACECRATRPRSCSRAFRRPSSPPAMRLGLASQEGSSSPASEGRPSTTASFYDRALRRVKATCARPKSLLGEDEQRTGGHRTALTLHSGARRTVARQARSRPVASSRADGHGLRLLTPREHRSAENSEPLELVARRGAHRVLREQRIPARDLGHSLGWDRLRFSRPGFPVEYLALGGDRRRRAGARNSSRTSGPQLLA